MTVGEAKERVRMLLDAYTSAGRPLEDRDLEARLPAALDGAQKHLAALKPIRRIYQVPVTAGATGPVPYAMPRDFGFPVRVLADWEPVPGRFAGRSLLVDGAETRRIRVEYDAVPATIGPETPEGHLLELEEDACACLPVYAAATLATGDPSCDAAGLMALFQRQAAGLRVMGKAGLRVVKLA
jgi:hypothetical protein